MVDTFYKPVISGASGAGWRKKDLEHPRGPEQFRRDGGGLQHLGRIKGIPPPTEYTPLY